MTSIQPLTYSQEPSGGGLVTMGLGFLVLMYFMYDHFEKRLRLQAELNEGTEARFRVTEDRLATLNEVEEDVRALTEAEEERKSSWEDDVTEPGKYQAILGTGTVNGINVEFRFVRKKLDTFKSNRYWLLNDISTNQEMIQHFLEYNFKSYNFSKKGDKYVSTHLNNMAVGLDSLLYLECSFTGSVDGTGFNNLVVEQAKTIQGGPFKWKRALLDA